MTLYEINEGILNLIDGETGEILDVEKLEDLNLEREKKIENIALFIKNLTAEEKAYHDEKIVFQAKEAQAKRKKESLKSYLAYALQGSNFKTPKVSISYRKSDRLSIDENAIIPDEYLRYVAPEINKKDLKEAVKNGLQIEGVKLEEIQNMQIR